MNKTIPIFRAKKIDSDEYVEGYFLAYEPECHYCILNDKVEQWEIDPTTLAIHFPNMIDSQGNRIFASLREDGKGGDILVKEMVGYIDNNPEVFTAIMFNGNTYARYSDSDKELLYNLISSNNRVNKCELKVLGVRF